MPGINVWVAKEVATDPVCASELASVRDLDHPITIGSYSPGAQRQAVRGVAGRLVGHSDAANPAALPLDLIDLTLAVVLTAGQFRWPSLWRFDIMIDLIANTKPGG